MFNRGHREGDEAARQQCRSWFRTVRHRLYLYARQRADSAADVELLLSRTLERVAEAVYRGRVSTQEEALLPYTLRALSNEAIRIGLSERRRREAELTYYSRNMHEQPAGASGMSAELQRKLASFVYSLPEKQMEIVLLHIWEERSFAEIGRMLGVGESTVRMRYEAAIRRMKQMMKEK